jgi:phosphoglycolate phosphatase
MGSEPLLVLWDIDHTLIDGGTASRSAYAAAFHRATGRPMTQTWRFDGRTELAAATDVLRAHGVEPDADLVENFVDLIVEELEGRADVLAAEGHALPGADDALAAVGALTNAHQSVLTGNLYPLAVLKMTVFGLADHVDFRIGAYGGDAYERTDLPGRAFERAERYLGLRFGGADTVIVGDTLRDIAAARAVGARVIGVATGYTSAAELEAGGADVVLADLSDTAAVLRALQPPVDHEVRSTTLRRVCN